MTTSLWGAGIFLVSFLVHLAVWRVKLPARQTKTLLSIMFSALGAALCLLRIFDAPFTAGDYLGVALLDISLILSYMITYSALEAESPSLIIVMTVAAAGSAGLPRDEFDAMMNDDNLVKPRIQDLLRDKMAYLEDGKYRLTAKGAFMAGLFTFYRGILGRGKGG